MSSDYFKVFDVKERFSIDEELLRKKYRSLSRSLHPDFFINEAKDKQDEVLQRSTQVNEAFKTLNDPKLRLEYILQNHGMIGIQIKQELEPSFLMEMMEINEELTEAQDGSNAEELKRIKTYIDSIISGLEIDLKKWTQLYDEEVDSNISDEAIITERLNNIKDIYLKNKYLLRIQEKINTFVSI